MFRIYFVVFPAFALITLLTMPMLSGITINVQTENGILLQPLLIVLPGMTTILVGLYSFVE